MNQPIIKLPVKHKPGRAAYRALKRELYSLDLGNADIAAALNRSLCYVAERQSGKAAYDTLEGYKILDLIEKPDCDYHVYFPRNPFEKEDT
jgi:hypothetical protein